MCAMQVSIESSPRMRRLQSANSIAITIQSRGLSRATMLLVATCRLVLEWCLYHSRVPSAIIERFCLLADSLQRSRKEIQSNKPATLKVDSSSGRARLVPRFLTSIGAGASAQAVRDTISTQTNCHQVSIVQGMPLIVITPWSVLKSTGNFSTSSAA
jgi:hypothetical protein